MSLAYTKPFVDATIRVFEEFFDQTPVAGKPFLLDRDESLGYEISAIIGIAGDSKGVVVISLPARIAMRLTRRLTGELVEAVNDDVIDTIGEVVNIIAGNAKKGLEQFVLSISLPSIVTGADHTIAWPQGVPIVGIPFDIDEGTFVVSVGLEDIIH